MRDTPKKSGRSQGIRNLIPARGTSARRNKRSRYQIAKGEVLDSRWMLTTLVFSEIQYDPHPPILELGEADVEARDFEFLELTNVGTQPVELAGIRLAKQLVGADAEGVDFVFGTGTLAAGERVVVASNAAAFGTRYGRQVNLAGEWSGGSLSNQGEMLTLLDSSGAIIQQLDYDDGSDWPFMAQGHGASLEMIDLALDASEPTNWRSSREVGGSPGREPIAAQAPRVLINEVLAHTDLPQYDTIELHNLTNQPVDLSGWYLSDRIDDPTRYAIPDGTILPAGGYFTVDERQFNPGGGSLPGDFAISEYGEELYLMSRYATGRPRLIEDMVIVGYTDNGHSVGNVNDQRDGRELLRLDTLTLGSANSPHEPSPLAITEIYYHPPDDYVLFEYVELKNITSEPVDVSNWELTDAVEYVFPEATTLPAGATVVLVSFDPADASLANEFRRFFGLDTTVRLAGPWSRDGDGVPDRLSDRGEKVSLYRPLLENGETYFALSEFVIYQDSEPWPSSADGMGASLNRTDAAAYPNESSHWHQGRPSPGDQPLRLGNLPPLTLDTPIQSNIGNDGLDLRGAVDVDIYQFVATDTSTILNFQLETETETMLLRIFSPSGVELARAVSETLDTDVLQGQLSLTLPEAGNYYVAVGGEVGESQESLAAVGGTPGDTGDYRLRVSSATDVSRHNADRPTDVNNDGIVSPFDALIVINELNARAAVQDGPSTGGVTGVGPPYFDVNDDGLLTPFDALLVINHLNSASYSSTPAATTIVSSPVQLMSKDIAAAVTDLTNVEKSDEKTKAFESSQFIDVSVVFLPES